MLRPISGSASIGVAVDIMKNYGVDSLIGVIASTIMGSTETTFYTIAVYTACIKIKKNPLCFISGFIGRLCWNDCVCSYVSIFVVKFFIDKLNFL